MERELLIKKIEAYYNDMSDEQLKDKLVKAGFEILDDKPGEIYLEDYEEDYEEFYLPKSITLNIGKKYRVGYDIQNTWELSYNSLLRNVV